MDKIYRLSTPYCFFIKINNNTHLLFKLRQKVSETGLFLHFLCFLQVNSIQYNVMQAFFDMDLPIDEHKTLNSNILDY